MTYKIPSPEGDCILYVRMSYRPSVHISTSIASVANASYIIKLLYNSTVSMVTDAIHMYTHVFIFMYACIQ